MGVAFTRKVISGRCAYARRVYFYTRLPFARGASKRGCLYPGAVFILAGAYMQCSRGAYCPYLYSVVRIPGGSPYVYPGVLIPGRTYTRGYAYPGVRIPGGTYTRGCLYPEVFILAAGYMLWYLFPVLMSRDTYSWRSLYPQSPLAAVLVLV